MSTKQNRAARLHAIAEELGVAPELVGTVGKGIRSDEAIRDAVKAYLAEQAKADASKPKEPKVKKAGLTLSQRRALLRLQDAGQDGIVPASAFRALPFVYLTENGLAELDGEAYVLTDAGVERADSINPGYRVWSAGETVVLDADGQPVVKDSDGNAVRPPAGTTRAQRAAEAKAKADAAAAAAAKQAEEDAAKKDEDETTETTKDVAEVEIAA